LAGHTDYVASVAFSPDGAHIASGGGEGDATIRLWDAATGEPIGQPMTGHANEVSSLAFSPDGDRIVSGSWDETIRLWPAFPDTVAAMCAKLPANMSHQQWRDWVSPDIEYIEDCPGLAIPADE
jgi:WD40 repeat protein